MKIEEEQTKKTQRLRLGEKRKKSMIKPPPLKKEYEQIIIKNCLKCKLEIEVKIFLKFKKQSKKLINSDYHDECYKCYSCEKLITKGFLAINIDEELYCSSCSTKKIEEKNSIEKKQVEKIKEEEKEKERIKQITEKRTPSIKKLVVLRKSNSSSNMQRNSKSKEDIQSVKSFEEDENSKSESSNNEVSTSSYEEKLKRKISTLRMFERNDTENDLRTEMDVDETDLDNMNEKFENIEMNEAIEEKINEKNTITRRR
jgi:hypothetical protein